MGDTLRQFVALVPRERSSLSAMIAPMRAVAPSARWTSNDALHVTLRFLGDVDTRDVGALVSRLTGVAGTTARPELVVSGAGVFQSIARARALWLGIVPNAELAALYHAVDAAVTGLGIRRELQPFRPHLTVARAAARGSLPPIEARNAVAAVGLSFTEFVPTLDLFASELCAAGARHRLIASLPFAGTGGDVEPR